MTLIDIIFNWYATYIFDTSGDLNGVFSDITFDIGGYNITFCEWLSATASIITICFLVAFLFLCVRWLFKVVAGLFTLRG